MAEFERTRIREREAPTQNYYEFAIQQDQERAERNMTGRVVCKQADCPQMPDAPRSAALLPRPSASKTRRSSDWIVFTHEIRTVSGKHRHQGGLIIYVIEGNGYSVVDGERCDWEKGDLVLLPLREKGVEHQHFNSNPDKPAVWMAFIHSPTHDHVASEMTQTEVSPEYKAAEERGGR